MKDGLWKVGMSAIDIDEAVRKYEKGLRAGIEKIEASIPNAVKRYRTGLQNYINTIQPEQE